MRTPQTATLQNPDALRRLREKDGLTQSALARKAGITSQHLNRLERSLATASPEVLVKLAAALAVEKSAITRAPCELQHRNDAA
jgi:transcriptional regulator with XRE-family HTH domain